VVDDGVAAVQRVVEAITNRAIANVTITDQAITGEVKAGNAAAGIDAILMDCEMPNLDGYGATREIRQLERAAGTTPIPIIALTAHALQEYRQRSREAGMDAHLNKPISLDALNEMLERYIKPAENN